MAATQAPPRPQMTPEDARTFDYHSEAHAQFLAQVAAERGCQCKPYVDWFTYDRWQALGRQVQRGEKAVRLRSFAPVRKRDEQSGEERIVGKRPRAVFVFCRCQTRERDADEQHA